MQSKPPEDVARLLAKVQVIGPLSEERALWLAGRVPVRPLEAGQPIFTPSYVARIFFVMLEGRVRLYKVLGAAELTLEIVEAGHLFGDVPALAGRPRGTYAEALTPSLVALLSTDVMRQLMQADPEVGMKLAEELAGRLYEYQQRMADVALKKVSARLASLFLRLLKTEGVVDREGLRVESRYTHDQLAAMVGSKRVAVSRAMGELRSLDAVEVKGRRVYLKDKAALRGAAEVGSREA